MGNRFTHFFLVLIVCSGVGASAGHAMASGDRAEGQKIAYTWCRSCHVVGAGSETATDAAPSLVDLAQDPGVTSERLTAFLTLPHGGMEGMNFSRQEVDDLVAYIESLDK